MIQTRMTSMKRLYTCSYSVGRVVAYKQANTWNPRWVNPGSYELCRKFTFSLPARRRSMYNILHHAMQLELLLLHRTIEMLSRLIWSEYTCSYILNYSIYVCNMFSYVRVYQLQITTFCFENLILTSVNASQFVCCNWNFSNILQFLSILHKRHH